MEPTGGGQKLYPITPAFIFMTQRRGAQETGGELGLPLSPPLQITIDSVRQLTGSSFSPPCQDDMFCQHSGLAGMHLVLH